ncbi:hypothetical protein [Alicyclobacillus ferrooxydans]|uniref:Uncharacterized protein n=1 Tax=Alicyclobacillus ferrooxydans TaxID=471514 RepID=A0A0P9CRC7_9BACL|nr:hypothetical protein [Alicyclobacillus ferrooxydans]KPV41971.1 hypothetical protein AN477_19535 [Alicyclobacillus ferrooxydans]
MNGFWPTAPFYIPYSTGMPNGWDLVWWLFQLGIMSGLLWMLYSVATGVDRDFVRAEDESREDKSV